MESSSAFDAISDPETATFLIVLFIAFILPVIVNQVSIFLGKPETQILTSHAQSPKEVVLDEMKRDAAQAVKEYQAELKAMFFQQEGDKVRKVLREELLEELKEVQMEMLAEFRMEVRRQVEHGVKVFGFECMVKARKEKEMILIGSKEFVKGETEVELEDSEEWVDLKDVD